MEEAFEKIDLYGVGSLSRKEFGSV